MQKDTFCGVTISMVGMLILLAGCSRPTGTQWVKGNLHTHSYWSDGDDYPERIMQWYKDHGYDFVALSDHNILAEGEKWIEIKKGTSRDSVFQLYLDEYGEDWVDYEDRDSLYRVRLKELTEYRALFEEPGEFLIVQSEEISASFEEKPLHVNATNIQERIEPRGGNSVADVLQNNIDAVLEQRERLGEPMFPHVNHPNFRWAVTAEDLKKLEGERFFEVYNGHPLVHNFGDSLHSGTEQMWDEINTHYIRNGKPLMYGIAVDDAHDYHTYSQNHSNPGRGWVRVRTSALSPDSIIAAMERGDFYASSGVELESIRFDGETLAVQIEPEEGVSYTVRFVGTLSENPEQTGVVLSEVEGSRASYSLSGDEFYVRAKVISDKLKENPYREGETEAAWIQPKLPNRE